MTPEQIQGVIDNLKLAEAEAGTDLQDFLSIVQRNYDKGLIVQLHSHELNDVRTFSISLEYRVPTTDVMIRKIVHSTGVIEDWAVVEKLII